MDNERTERGPAPGGRVFGRYTLIRVLGQGGMGIVWLAHDEELGVDVALKFVADHLRWDARVLAGLRREVIRARKLTHPGIVRIHDLVSDGAGAAIAMEYVGGGSLADRLAAGLAEEPPRVLGPGDLAPLLPVLAGALDYAHREVGVVHRDLKPSNILIAADGAPKIADFGVACSLAESATRTSGVQRSGTLAYMGPQQLHDEPPAAADDIYGLGATLYDLLAGSPPFRQGDIAGQIERKSPDRIELRRAATGLAGAPVPVEWEDAIAACLAKDARCRPQSAAEVLARLVPTKGVPNRDRRAQRLRFAAAGAMTAALVAGIWILGPANRAPTVNSAPPSDATRALAAWNFDGDGIDASGRGLNAVVQRAWPTVDRFGRIDRALQFNGAAALRVPDATALRWGGAEPFSVALWARPASGSGETEPLIGNVPAEVGDLIWALGLSAGFPQFLVGGHPRARAVVFAAGTPLARGTWHHLAAVSDGRSASLYVDGRMAASGPLGDNRETKAPKSAQLRVGSDQDSARAVFVGALDEVRLWRRALGGDEIARLAGTESPPRFAVSSGVFSDREDLAEGLRREFGAGAELADWDDIRRWHGDDLRGWAEETGFAVGGAETFVQRGGRTMHDATRRYFVSRFDGTVPDYYGVHDELGGRTLVLGSWHGNNLRAVVRLPPVALRRETLAAEGSAGVRKTFSQGEITRAFAATWRMEIGRTEAGGGTIAEVRLRDGRVWSATCGFASEEGLAIAFGDRDRPERTHHAATGAGTHELTLVVKAGRLSFRGQKVVGGATVFSEEIAVPSLRVAEVVACRVSGVDAVELIVE